MLRASVLSHLWLPISLQNAYYSYGPGIPGQNLEGGS